VRRNALWNILGLGFPLALALLSVPFLIKGMGAERFGILTLILAFLSYFGFLDLGIGRALTQLLASSTSGDSRRESALIWTVSAMLAVPGVFAACAVFFLSPPLVQDFLRVPEALVRETVLALRAVGFTLPFLIHGLALRGVLEARRRFDLSNLVRIPVAFFTFGAPLLVLPFSRNVATIVIVILTGRLLAWGLNVWMVFRILPHVWTLRGWMPREIWNFTRFGGWYTVCNAVAPVIDGMDRFLIGRMLSVGKVAFYTMPYDAITRLGILSGSVGGAIFPEFAARLATSRESAAALYRRGLKYLLAVLFPFTLVSTAYAHELLSLWLTPAIAGQSAPVLRWLSVLVLISGVNGVSVSFLHGAGRPDIVARLYLLEVPVLAGLLYLFIRLDGLRGAAIACVARIVLDFSGQLFFAGRLLRFQSRTYGKIVLPLGVATAALLLFHVPMGQTPKACLFAVVLAVYAWASWSFILEEGDKASARGALRRIGRRPGR
jgi:O-antigen/teichoic acid export membrane protein